MKANKPETTDEILQQLQYGTAMSDNTEPMLTNNRNVAKQSLRQLLLAGVPEKRSVLGEKLSNQLTEQNRLRNEKDRGFNACRQVWIDYINRITE